MYLSSVWMSNLLQFKEARINIRLSKTDLEQIKQKAAYEGLPYQTLIASILHKYAEDILIYNLRRL